MSSHHLSKSKSTLTSTNMSTDNIHSHDRVPVDMEAHEREVLDFEQGLDGHSIPYIDTDEANMPTPCRPSKLRQDLFFAIQKNDLQLLVDTAKRIRSNGSKVNDPPFRQEGTGTTALCYAIQHDRNEAVDVIMLYQKNDLLSERYDYDGRETLRNHVTWRQWADVSRLTCLHLLAERNLTRAVRLFLRLCPLKTDEETEKLHRFLALPALKDMGRRYDDTGAPNGRLVSCLHVAAANGNTELVDLLVKRGADADQTYGEDFTKASPMAFAVENDRLETFRKLLEFSKVFGPPDTLKVNYLAEFLKVAAMAGAKVIVDELLRLAVDQGVNKVKIFQDAVDAGCVEAIRMGHNDIAESLTRALDSSKLNEALREAVKRGNKTLVEDLLEKGAKVDDTTTSSDNLPLMLCVQHEKSDVLPAILPKANLIPEEFWKGVAASKDEFARQVFDNYRRSKKDRGGKLKFSNNDVTPMHIAAGLDKVDVLLQFGHLGARYDLLDPRGNTILHTAAQHNAQVVVKETLEYFNPSIKNKDGDTPLLIACKNSRPKVAAQMLRGKDQALKVPNNAGDLPLHVAVKQLLSARARGKLPGGEKFFFPATREDRLETLEVVVQTYSAAGLLDEKDARGNTALNLLVQEGREAEIRLFTQASPTIRNDEGSCALDFAMRSYYTKPSLLSAMLNTFGIKVAVYLATDFKHDGYPPLHLFAMKRDLQNVKLMVENGASVTELNEEGLTIMHMIAQLTAEDNNNEEIYILIARIIIDALVDYRIRRQMDMSRFLYNNYYGIFLTDGEATSPTLVANNVDSVFFAAHDEVVFVNNCDKTPLVVNANKVNGGSLYAPEGVHGIEGSFLVSSRMSRDDVRRVLMVYLTRLVKSRDGMAVVNYAASVKAVGYLKYVLEVRKRMDTNKAQSGRGGAEGGGEGGTGSRAAGGSETTKQDDVADDAMQERPEDDLLSETGDRTETVAMRRQTSTFEDVVTHNFHDYDALQPDTILVSYDVSCLSPETMMDFQPRDVAWVTVALEERFLQHVFNVLKRKRQLFEMFVDDHHATSENQGATPVTHLTKIMDKAKQWGIHEFFSRLDDRRNTPPPLIVEPEQQKVTSKGSTPDKKPKKKKKSSSVGSSASRSRSIQEPAMLETIVELPDEVMAARILDLMPLTKLVESYWSVYRWMYFVIMLVHIIYMGTFSMTTIGRFPTCVPKKNSVRSETTTVAVTTTAAFNTVTPEPLTYPVKEYFIFLLYPFIFLAVTIYFETVQIVAKLRRVRLRRAGTLGRVSVFVANIMDVPYDALTFFLENLPTIGSFAFALSMLFWYLNYMDSCSLGTGLDSSNNAAYLLSACLVIGWLQTITYSRGFESLHSFKNVMKNIVLSDILRFFMVYIFVNIGFSFGFHVLLYLVDGENTNLLRHQATPLHTVFYNLKLFTNPADIFDIHHFESFKSPAGLMYVRAAFLTYSFVSGLILVNILIAMMNDSYTRVNETERITWRVGSLRQAMAVFRAFPFIMKLKERVSRGSESQTHQTNVAERPSVTLYDIRCTVNVTDDEPELDTDDRLDAIERDVKAVQENVDDVKAKMDTMIDSREDMKILLTAVLAKVDECNAHVRTILASKSSADLGQSPSGSTPPPPSNSSRGGGSEGAPQASSQLTPLSTSRAQANTDVIPAPSPMPTPVMTRRAAQTTSSTVPHSRSDVASEQGHWSRQTPSSTDVKLSLSKLITSEDSEQTMTPTPPSSPSSGGGSNK